MADLTTKNATEPTATGAPGAPGTSPPTATEQSASEQYAYLHRVMENGEQTETNWARLGRVCIELGKKDEALLAFEHVTAHGLRRDLQRRLAEKGWVSPVARDDTKNVTVTEADLSLSTQEKLWDALQFLLDGHMRWAVLAGTVAFPVVLALGGALTASSDSFLLRLLAAVPALFVVGMVGAFGRHVLVQSLRATDDASDLPEPRTLWREVPRFLVDFVGLTVAFLGPGSVVLLFGQPMLALLFLLPAAFLMPMAAVLRLAGNDWHVLSPKLLLPVVRGCPSYASVAKVITLLFTPSLVAFLFTVGKPLFLLISVVGPLSVAPFFVAMRMLGLTLHYERACLRGKFRLPGDPASAPPAPPPPAAPASRPATQDRRAPAPGQAAGRR